MSLFKSRAANWTEATVTDPCGRHTKVESWHIKQRRPGGLNSAPLCQSSFSGLAVASHYHTHSVPTFTPSRETIQLWKTAALELLTVRCVWECWSFDVLAGQDALFLLSLSLSFLESCPVQQLPRAVWLKMIGFILVGARCVPGAAVGSFSGLLHSL